MKINLEKLKIKKGSEPIVIAEIGINHGGNINLAIKMAELAIKAGANIVKHQTHFVEDEMSLEAKEWKVDYIGKSIWDLMEECSLTKDEEIKLKSFVENQNVIYLSTPFSRNAADFLEEINIPAFKIGSGECNNYQLLEHIAKYGKPMILSTGMNDIDQVKKSCKILERYNIDFALMHTTNSYPTVDSDVRLGGLTQLIKLYPDKPIGLSDHTIGNLACFAGVAIGADFVERHFTDSIKREGPDIKCSMTPSSCRNLVEGIKRIYEMRGGEKKIVDAEKSVSKFAFSSVVTNKEIRQGEEFTKNNIWVRRPSTGFFKAENYSYLLGKKAKNHIKKNVQLKQSDVE